MLPGVDRFVMGGDFDRWLDSVDLYLEAMEVISPARKRAILLHLIGPDLQQVYGTLPEPGGAGDEYQLCKDRLKAYLAPARNTIAEKLAFQTVKMDPGERFEAYLARLRVAANRCGFTGRTMDQEVRDQCLAGTRGKLQERLLQRAAERGDQLTLQDVVAAAAAMERTQALIDQMQGPGAAAEPVQLVAGDARRSLTCFRCGKRGHRRAECRQLEQQQQTEQLRPERPGRGPVCYRCRQPGHLKRDCRLRSGPSAVQAVVEEPEDLWNVQLAQGSEGCHVAPVKLAACVNGRSMEFEVDTGSPVTIVGSNHSIPGLQLQRSGLKLTSFTGHAIPIQGEGVVEVQSGQAARKLRVVVAAVDTPVNLLGMEWLSALGLTPPGALQKEQEPRRTEELRAADTLSRARLPVRSPADKQAAALEELTSSLRTAANAGIPMEQALDRVLQAYRSAPRAVTGRTPAERHYGRRRRAQLSPRPRVPCADATPRAARADQHRADGGRAREFRPGTAVCAAGETGWSRQVDRLLTAGLRDTAGDGSGRRSSDSAAASAEDGGGGRSGATRSAGQGGLLPLRTGGWSAVGADGAGAGDRRAGAAASGGGGQTRMDGSGGRAACQAASSGGGASGGGPAAVPGASPVSGGGPAVAPASSAGPAAAPTGAGDERAVSGGTAPASGAGPAVVPTGTGDERADRSGGQAAVSGREARTAVSSSGGAEETRAEREHVSGSAAGGEAAARMNGERGDTGAGVASPVSGSAGGSGRRLSARRRKRVRRLFGI